MSETKNSIRTVGETDNIVVGKIIHSGEKSEMYDEIRERHPEFEGKLSLTYISDNVYNYYFFKE